MKIRVFEPHDKEAIGRIHANSNLPAVCLFDCDNPLHLLTQVVELHGQTALVGSVKLTGEAFLLVDHSIGTSEERWQALKALSATIEVSAMLRGLDCITAWIPPDIAKSFGPRLEELGYIKSPWVSYSKLL